jgi:hypothetical protein
LQPSVAVLAGTGLIGGKVGESNYFGELRGIGDAGQYPASNGVVEAGILRRRAPYRLERRMIAILLKAVQHSSLVGAERAVAAAIGNRGFRGAQDLNDRVQLDPGIQ